MILESVGILLIVLLFAIVINGIERYNKRKEGIKMVEMSFREAMDLVSLPVVTFYNGNKKLNFLLDTGSDISYINGAIIRDLDYRQSDKESINTIGAEGIITKVGFCEMDVVYKEQKFSESFAVKDLEEAFNYIKIESGVLIHGILGSRFFQKYKYILDFEKLIAYNK